MAVRIPSVYTKAAKLSADARGALACARLVWDSLSVAEQTMLRRAVDGSIWYGRRRTRERLRSAGLSAESTTPARDHLTVLGRLVREAGISTRVEVHDAA